MNTKPDQTLHKSEENITQQPDGEKAAYPDISKANTKTVVIISFVFVLLIFLLSVFVPQ